MLKCRVVALTEEVYNLSSPRSLGVEVVNNESDHCAICMARGSSQAPTNRTRDNSPGDFTLSI